MPGPLELVVLILAAFRLWRLLGVDDFPPIARARAWAVGEREDELGTFYERPTLEHFLSCPYCLGAWISLVLYVSWLLTPTLVDYAAVPLAVSAAVGLVAANLND